MKRYTILAGVLIANVAFADSRAVEESNYQASLSLGMDDPVNSSGKFTHGDLAGAVTLPLAEYLGASISGGYSQGHSDNESLSCNLDSSGIGVGLFVRDFDIGRIGVNYSRSRNSWCTYSTFGGHDHGTTDADTASASASYYFRDITVGASYAYSRSSSSGVEWLDEGSRDNSILSVGVRYYPINNLAASLSVSRNHNDIENRDSSTLSFEYQPDFFGNSTSLTLSLSNSEYSNSATLGVNYFFGKQVDLITRDRRYR